MDIRIRRVCGVLAMGILAAAFPGCKAGEAKEAGFVDRSVMENDPSLPFQRVWRKADFDKAKYHKLYVAPVNTAYMLKMTEWQEGMRREDFERDVAQLAEYTRNSLKKAFAEDPKQRMQIIDAPSSAADVLILEMALTEVVPSKVVLNALGYVPFGIGMGITAVRSIAKDVSTVAAEARLRDGATGQIVGMMSDREAEQMAVVSVRGLTWYSHANAIVDQWSKQLVEAANRKPGEKVKDADTFTLKPW